MSARRVGILGHTRRPGVRRAAARLAAALARRGCPVRWDADLAEEIDRPVGSPGTELEFAL